MNQPQVNGRMSVKIDRKFEDSQQSRPSLQPIRDCLNIGIPKSDRTIHYPKQQNITILKPPRTGSTNSSISAGNITLTYDMICPPPIQTTFIDRVQKFFNIDDNVCKCPTGGNCPLAKLWIGSTDMKALKDRYNSYVGCEQQYIKQINLDVERTLPLATMKDKLISLKRILRAYAAKEPAIGYMQGMNFLACTLLYHCDEVTAFGLLCKVIEQLQLRDIYMPRSPGLSKHIQIIDCLILTKLPDLYQHFCIHSVKADMFCAPWLFSMFGMMIPLHQMGKFWDSVFKDGWTYVYKFVIAFLLYNLELLLSEDMSGIISLLVSQNYRIDNEMQSLDIDWDELLVAAQNVQISKSFVLSMHLKYDHKGQVFKV